MVKECTLLFHGEKGFIKLQGSESGETKPFLKSKGARKECFAWGRGSGKIGENREEET